MTPCSYTSVTLSSTGEQVIDSINRPSSPSFSAYCGSVTILPSLDWHHEILFRFSNRTVLTMGSSKTIPKYAEVVPRLAIQHSHLLHITIAITLLHDRALGGSALYPTTNESYHLSCAAAMFNAKLSATITNNDKDALWATAVYMCATSVFNIPSSDIEENWPLRTRPDDLKWLNLQAGLRVVWSLADLHRPGGVFSTIVDHSDENCVFPRVPEPGVAGLPPALIELCGLTGLSNGTNNPYHTAIRHLSWLFPIKASPANLLTFMIFAGGMTAAYRNLLQQRDPRALLLFGVWYSRLFNTTWWMVPRARIECQAIHRYLVRLQIHDLNFQRVLELLGHAIELQYSASLGSMTWDMSEICDENAVLMLPWSDLSGHS